MNASMMTESMTPARRTATRQTTRTGSPENCASRGRPALAATTARRQPALFADVPELTHWTQRGARISGRRPREDGQLRRRIHLSLPSGSIPRRPESTPVPAVEAGAPLGEADRWDRLLELLGTLAVFALFFGLALFAG